MRKLLMWSVGMLFGLPCICQQKSSHVSKTWVADLGNGSYKNPILHADYSDPDVCRVGDAFYMTASSFDAVPGLPILKSHDLVNWSLIGHALLRQLPYEHFSHTQHGNGVWAPALRYHDEEFFLYYPDPDFGIYLTKAKDPKGPWSPPVLVESGKGLIDPCPLWDDDGQLYLVHAYAGSRAEIKSILVVKKLNKEGTKVLDEGKMIYDGHEMDPTIEGPKFYKRNGYYYVFAPAGGVATGWQLVLRSKSLYGPYERKVVMDQGNTEINGPHQGAWVETPKGESWFLHFQDKGVYGRVLHLQPMKWRKDWPVIGEDPDEDGKGQPVLVHQKPFVDKSFPIVTPPESDEFSNQELGLQWQWQANPQHTWAFMQPAKGTLRLYTQRTLDSTHNLWQIPNVLLQKLPAEEFSVTVKFAFRFNPKLENERIGLVMMGQSYAYLALKSEQEGNILSFVSCEEAIKGNKEQEKYRKKIEGQKVYLRLSMQKGGICYFFYSENGNDFTKIESPFQAVPGLWIGAKMGLFATRASATNDAGYADVDWFLVGK